MSENIVNFPGKESSMEPKPKTEQEDAYERLDAVKRAVLELSSVPTSVLAGLRFERKDGSQVGANWLLRQFGNQLTGLQGRIRDCRTAKVPAEAVCD